MNKFLKGIFATLAFGFLMMFSNSTIFAQSKSEVLIVADRRADCTGVAATKCLQVKKPQDEKWTLFYQQIENFNYVEGNTYIVRVQTEAVKNPPADGSNLKYKLKKILYREKTAGENSNENTSGDNADLSANEWKLIRVDGAAIDSTKASISFNFEKNSVGGNGGCNGFGGNLAVNGGEIKISQVISTKMFCEATSEVENKFLSNLERVTKYRISDGKLFLLAGETVVLEFAPKS